MQPKDEIELLRKQIRFHSDLYYNQDNPILSDTQYDELQATVLDPSEPVIVLIDSQDKEFVFVESRT